MATRQEQQAKDRFSERYREERVDVVRTIEHTVIGGDWGANGYTTIAQADQLGALLNLRQGSLLLDVGAGRGWPGLYLATTTGCSVVLTDVPMEGLSVARRTQPTGRARRSRLVHQRQRARPPVPGRHVRRRRPHRRVVLTAPEALRAESTPAHPPTDRSDGLPDNSRHARTQRQRPQARAPLGALGSRLGTRSSGVAAPSRLRRRSTPRIRPTSFEPLPEPGSINGTSIAPRSSSSMAIPRSKPASMSDGSSCRRSTTDCCNDRSFSAPARTRSDPSTTHLDDTD